MIAEHALVVLDCDPPHEKLNRGDVGTVVHVYKGGRGYEVEFVDGGVRTVPRNAWSMLWYMGLIPSLLTIPRRQEAPQDGPWK